MRYHFGDFVFDAERQEVHRGAAEVHLTPKAMRLLEMLIAGRGRVVRRQDLVDELWPDVVVSEASLKNLVALLRTALGDHGREGGLIRTAHNRGYRFTDDVVVAGPAPTGGVSARLLRGDQWFALGEGPHLVGREADCEIVIDHSTVSRHHARITVLPDRIVLEDLDSKNGTFISGDRVREISAISSTSQITFGRVVTRLVVESASPSTESASAPPTTS